MQRDNQIVLVMKNYKRNNRSNNKIRKFQKIKINIMTIQSIKNNKNQIRKSLQFKFASEDKSCVNLYIHI